MRLQPSQAQREEFKKWKRESILTQIYQEMDNDEFENISNATST